nr:MAG TPA: HIGH-POTENTIAL IRON-SULFUR PROTEIN (HIPIP) TRANSFER(IRON-SULFUR PROTEIN) [Caudoviricetes sp.]
MKNGDKHCSNCIHYEPCVDFRMYCKNLKRRITVRKNV